VYFNLAAVLWTTCFAFTLYRDVMRSYRRHALRKYEAYFHSLCWPLAALPAGYLAALSHSEQIDGVGSWCALNLTFSRPYLLAFHGPLLVALAFVLLICCAVVRNSRERRVSRTTSLYLLAFVIVWLPTLASRLQVHASKSSTPAFWLAIMEAACSPLQGALNAAVYGWSLPSIRDVYRRLLLGDDGLDIHHSSNGGESPGYSPPDSDAALPVVNAAASPCGRFGSPATSAATTAAVLLQKQQLEQEMESRRLQRIAEHSERR